MKNILNYQGNKKKLLPFIDNNISTLIPVDKYFLDIFSGGGSVSFFYASKCKVAFNDLEKYSFHIVNAFLNSSDLTKNDVISSLKIFKKYYEENLILLKSKLHDFIEKETEFIESGDITIYENYSYRYPSIWNHGFSSITNDYLTVEKLNDSKIFMYILFTTYYANTYFGIQQCIEIDSIRYAINKIPLKLQSLFFTALYHAMNLSVFSKDGHMAQPLSMKKYTKRGISRLKISVINELEKFINDFEIIQSNYDYKGFNMDFEELIKTDFFKDKIGLVYADPPYTDMQYSRYYHLLNTVTEYEFKAPTIKKDLYTKGLYLENRTQSKLSCKGTCIDSMKKLIDACNKYKKNLVISFGYPEKNNNEKTDRYVMDINELILLAKKIYGDSNVEVVTEGYLHSNHRNSFKKRVLEYLIVCRGGEK